MENNIHLRPPDHVKMHEMVMIGDQIVELPLRQPSRIGKLEIKQIAVLQCWTHLEPLIDILRVSRRICFAPAVSQQDHCEAAARMRPTWQPTRVAGLPLVLPPRKALLLHR